MIILGIETSCDDTAISVINGSGGLRRPKFEVLSHIVSSQTAIHAPWGGVVPNLAKREHARNLIPVLQEALRNPKVTPWGSKGVTLNLKGEALLPSARRQGSTLHPSLKVEPSEKDVKKILAREPELLEQFLEFIPTIAVPKIDAIAVTVGPGLEPALWAGINLARALALVWRKKLIPINHIEGHIISALADMGSQGEALRLGSKASPLKEIKPLIKFPALALIISGGHTELVVIKDWFKYKIIGQTRDDAVGEAFDKVARLLGLPYPGGPEISKLAVTSQGKALHPRLKALPFTPFEIKLPRPMIDSPDFDFSFSGLKTAVLYLAQKLKGYPWAPEKGNPCDPVVQSQIAREFQQAVIDVLLAKTIRAVDKYQPKTLIIAGGVAANQELRQQFTRIFGDLKSAPILLIPSSQLSTDNATMIAMAGYLRHYQGSTLHPSASRRIKVEPLRADGRLILK